MLLVAASFGGFAVLISLVMMAGTLALTLNERRREFAVLRAIGATPRQVLSLVGAEAVMLAAVAATLGAVTGVALADVMRRTLVRFEVMPDLLALSVTPLAGVTGILLTVLTAVLGALAVAYGPASVDPLDALRDSAVEAGRPRGWHTPIALICGAAGLGVALVPLVLQNDVGAAGTGTSALLLVIGASLAGSTVLRPFVNVAARLLERRGPAGFLAAQNVRGRMRRLRGVLTPLMLAIGFAVPMIYTQTTLSRFRRKTQPTTSTSKTSSPWFASSCTSPTAPASKTGPPPA